MPKPVKKVPGIGGLICAPLIAFAWFFLGVSAASAQFILEGERSYPVRSTAGMVVTSHYLATQEALAVLEKGGNAVDAAVTAAFALAVTQPRSGNLGGGGFMLIASDSPGRVTSIDYRETAPALASESMFLNEAGDVDSEKSRFSHQSSGVPGTVAGLLMALERYGTWKREAVLQPAIRLAEEGFIVTDRFSQGLKQSAERLKRWPAARKLFFKPDGSFYEPGERFRQPELAETLKRIAQQGRAGFYEGKTADLIVQEMERGQGLITRDDLRNYRPIERPPVRGSYRGYDVYSMGPPSSGGVHIIQLLNMLEAYPLGEWGHNSAMTVHHLAESMRRAYADRSRYLGDQDFVKVPLAGLLSKAYADELRGGISPSKATPSSDIKPGEPGKYESPETTHFSIVDQYGNAVSNTYTINFSYGSHIAVEGAGFLLNNEMDDFSAQPGVANAYGLLGGEANRIEPGKRMLSSMSPTILKKEGRTVLVTGSPGGSRIITTTLQVILNVIDHQMNIQSAVNAPRMHHQWYPDEIRIEEGFSVDTLRLLESIGHEIRQSPAMGAIQSIWIGEDGSRYGAADPRRETSSALGY